MIFALAGHVDHGKTTLIRALTGIDTDRLGEEKRRGMTIDLGFAYSDLPGGGRVGFVDVPGHEHFLANMLAGVLGVQAVLLIVAADDGPMPQTLEHLAILRLTGIPDLIVVLTKIDAVEKDRLNEAERDVSDMLARFGYAEAVIIPVSSTTGAGIPRLQHILQERTFAKRRPSTEGGFRLAVDRKFVLPGTGLVVTGTVFAGRARVGETLLLTPARLSARVRSIRVQDQDTMMAIAGDRAAIAIAGTRVERGKLRRGDWLVAPHLHAPTSDIDVYVRTAIGRVLKRDVRLHVHTGTSAVPARALAIAGADLPTNDAGFFHLALDYPTAALHGDPVVLRDDGSGRILAGGRVVDPFPSATRRSRAVRLAGLHALMEQDPTIAFDRWLTVAGHAEPRLFAIARNVSGFDTRPGVVAVSDAFRVQLHKAVLLALTEWHRAHPEYPGPSRATLLAQLSRRHPRPATVTALQELIVSSQVVAEGTIVRLPGHSAALAALDEALWPRVHSLLENAGLRPPRLRELMVELDLPIERTQSLLDGFIRFGRLIRVSANRCFLPKTLDEITRIVIDMARASEDFAFTAAEFNARTKVGRNLAVEILEHLDQVGLTVRQGELRHVVTGGSLDSAPAFNAEASLRGYAL